MVQPAEALEEEAFPRGGADLLSPLEKRQLNAKAKADAAREAAEGKGDGARGSSSGRKRSKKVRFCVWRAAAVQSARPAGGRDGAPFRHPHRTTLTPITPPSFNPHHHTQSDDDPAARQPSTKKKNTKEQQPKRRPTATKNANADAEADDFFRRERAAGKTAKYVELLKFRHLSPGMRLWGAVLEVSPRRLVVSLPHGLRGVVRPDEASDALHELLRLKREESSGNSSKSRRRQEEAEALLRAMPGGKVPCLTRLFSVGQYVRCAVLSVKGGGEGVAAAADADNDDNAPDDDGQQQRRRRASGPRKEIELSLRLHKTVPASAAAALLSAALKEGQGGQAAAAAAKGASPPAPPPVVLPCCVKSAEDHGYVVKCGAKGVGGFLMLSEAEKGADASAPRLLPGALVDAVVTSAAGGAGRLALAPLPAQQERPLPDAAADDGLTLAALLPGTLVEARVREALGDTGVVVSFLRYFHGTIDRDHLPLVELPSQPKMKSKGGAADANDDDDDDDTKASMPAVGSRLLARVLFVDPSTRRVGLSALPHVVGRALPSGPLPRLGEVLEGAVVRRVDPGLGLALDLPGGGGAPIRAFCHVSNALDPEPEKEDEDEADGKKKKKSKGKGKEKAAAVDDNDDPKKQAAAARRLKAEFKVGQARRARVIGYRLLDGLAVVSLRASVVDAPVMSAAELHPAQLVTATVVQLVEAGGGGAAAAADSGKPRRHAGVLVELAPGVRALVPVAHLTDAGCDGRDAEAADRALKRAAKRGVPGSGGQPLVAGCRITGRVLSVDPATRRVTLTLKPTLVKGRLPPLADLATASAALAATAGGNGRGSASSSSAVKAHGTVTGVAPFGAYVQLYGGLSGLVPVSAMGLLPDQAPEDVLGVGQVVRVRVTGVEPLKRRLRLATAGGGGDGGGKAAAAAKEINDRHKAGAQAEAAARARAALGRWQAGDVVGADVEAVVVGVELSPSSSSVSAVRVRLDPGGVPARLPREHLSDHPAAAAALADALHAAVAAAETIAAASGGEPSYPRLPALGGGAGERALVLELRAGGGGGGKSSSSSTSHPPYLLLTRKSAMVLRAAELPRDFDGVAALDAAAASAPSAASAAAILPGYIASVTADAAYVRFLGGITGRAGLANLADVFVALPSRLFSPGQTVFARVVQVDAAKRRFALSLRPSLTGGSRGAELLAALLADLDAAATLQEQAQQQGQGGGALLDLAPGSLVRATVHEHKPYGVLCDLEAHEDLVGVLLPGHEGGEGGGAGAAGAAKGKKKQQQTSSGLAVGAPLTARALDVDRAQGVVELSARPELLVVVPAEQEDGGKKKSKKSSKGAAAATPAPCLPEGASVDAATVLLCKPHYTVLSVPLPGSGACAIAFAPVADYNTLGGAGEAGGSGGGQDTATPGAQQLQPGAVVRHAVVAAAPSAATGGRLILRLPAAGAKRRREDASAGAAAGGNSNKAARLDHNTAAGPTHGILSATVAEVLPTGLVVTYGGGAAAAAEDDAAPAPPRRAHVHVSELPEGAALSSFSPGQRLRCAVLPALHPPAPRASVAASASTAASSRRHHGVELSLRAEALAAAEAGGKAAPAFDAAAPGALRPGARVVGWVAAITAGGADSPHAPAVWLSLGPAARARLDAAQTAEPGDDASEDQLAAPGAGLAGRFPLGARVEARVLALTKQQHQQQQGKSGGHGSPASSSSYVLDVTLRAVDVDVDEDEDEEQEAAAPSPAPGSLMLGRVAAAPRGSGVLVVFGPRRGEAGVVAVTDLHDRWVPNALEGLAAGAYVRASVLPGARDGHGRVPLSLRPSDGGRVIGSGAAATPAASTATAAAAPALLSDEAIAPNQPARGYVRAVGPKGAFVALDRSRVAHVRLRDLGDGFVEDPAAAFPEGSLVTGRLLRSQVAGADPKKQQGKKQQQQPEQQPLLRMTLRPPRAAPADRLASSGAGLPVRSAADLEIGEVLRGFVRRVEKYGLFVAIGAAPPAAVESNANDKRPPGPLCGLAHVSSIASGDLSPEDLARRYRPGQAVKARVTAVDADKGRIALSLRREDVGSGSRSDDEDEDDDGSDDDDGAAADAMDVDEGRAGKKRSSKKRAAAGDLDDLMLAAADGSEEEESSDDEDDEEEEESGSEDEEEEDDDGLGFSSGSDDDEEEEEDEDEDEDDDEDAQDQEEDPVAAAVATAARIAAAAAAGKKTAAGTDSDDDDSSADGSSDDEEDDEGEGKTKHRSAAKRAKKRARVEREEEIRAAEARRAAHGPAGAAPQAPQDYERLLLASPASSLLWVRYMAHLVASGEPAAARRVAERALEAIPFREQGEKFNVWMALINLEAAYGAPTPEEAVAATFRRASPATDTKRLHLAVLQVLDRPPPQAALESGGGSVPPSAAARKELADGLMKAALKKFGGSCKVWLAAVERALAEQRRRDDEEEQQEQEQQGEEGAARAVAAAGDAVRRLLERATAALPKRKHSKLLTRAALLEFRLGSAERGRSLLEAVLGASPKRLDLWSVYADQELRQLQRDEMVVAELEKVVAAAGTKRNKQRRAEDEERVRAARAAVSASRSRARALFERATALALPPRKMKFLFRRWLEFERAHGDAAGVKRVREAAVAFVAQAAAGK
jgi:rRNA biogenesis protein RRP5